MRALLLPLVLAACDPCPGALRVQVTARALVAVDVCAALADTDEERAAGLTAYPPLGDDDALLLSWPQPIQGCITTAPVDQDLDLVFASETGSIVQTACGHTPDDPVVCVDGVTDILELLPREGCDDWVGGTLRVDDPLTR